MLQIPKRLLDKLKAQFGEGGNKLEEVLSDVSPEDHDRIKDVIGEIVAGQEKIAASRQNLATAMTDKMHEAVGKDHQANKGVDAERYKPVPTRRVRQKVILKSFPLHIKTAYK